MVQISKHTLQPHWWHAWGEPVIGKLGEWPTELGNDVGSRFSPLIGLRGWRFYLLILVICNYKRDFSSRSNVYFDESLLPLDFQFEVGGNGIYSTLGGLVALVDADLAERGSTNSFRFWGCFQISSIFLRVWCKANELLQGGARTTCGTQGSLEIFYFCN